LRPTIDPSLTRFLTSHRYAQSVLCSSVSYAHSFISQAVPVLLSSTILLSYFTSPYSSCSCTCVYIFSTSPLLAFQDTLPYLLKTQQADYCKFGRNSCTSRVGLTGLSSVSRYEYSTSPRPKSSPSVQASTYRARIISIPPKHLKGVNICMSLQLPTHDTRRFSFLPDGVHA
jgi:hypothetical protein